MSDILKSGASHPSTASMPGIRLADQLDRIALTPPPSTLQRAWHVVRRSPPSIKLCLLVLTTLVLVAALAPILISIDPTEQDLRGRLLRPMEVDSAGVRHLFGTDHLGRDIFARVVYGARISLGIAVIGTVLGLLLGTSLGLFAGFMGGRMDQGLMFLVDVQQALPFLVICLVAIAVFGTSLVTLIILIGFAGWETYARYARGGTLAARESQYVLASRATGATNYSLVFRHILPNVSAPLIVVATLNVTGIIVLESSLSFLGIGVQPPTPSWGGMLSEGRQYMGTAWWIAIFPAAVMVLATLAVALVGDWLRDVLDPTSRQH